MWKFGGKVVLSFVFINWVILDCLFVKGGFSSEGVMKNKWNLLLYVK